jgi:simple sugar transport system permease protein
VTDTDQRRRADETPRPAMDRALLAEVLARPASGGGRLDGLLAGVRRGADRGSRPVLSFVVTITVALLATLPIVWMSGASAASAATALLDGSLGSPRAIAETLLQLTPLLLAGLAVAVAFHGGLFNIGVEGQLVVGGLAGAVVAGWDPVPDVLRLPAGLLAGMLGGALWVLVPALLKAVRGVHEVVTTIMLNYVAFALSQYLVGPEGPFVSATQPSATERVPEAARLPGIWDGTRLHAGFLVALAVAALVGWLVYRTSAGFRLRLVGANPEAARAHGVSVVRTTVWAMLASGALAGLAGAIEVLGLYGRYYDSFSPGYGFDAIAVALLGGLTPLGTLAAAAFFGLLGAGSVQLQAVAGINRELIAVVSGIVVASVAAQPAVRRLIDRLRRRARPPEPAPPPEPPQPPAPPSAGGSS